MIAINPNPVPPLVHTSPAVLRSRANPLTGCPQSQKYRNVASCTEVSNSSSVRARDLAATAPDSSDSSPPGCTLVTRYQYVASFLPRKSLYTGGGWGAAFSLANGPDSRSDR